MFIARDAQYNLAVRAGQGLYGPPGRRPERRRARPAARKSGRYRGSGLPRCRAVRGKIQNISKRLVLLRLEPPSPIETGRNRLGRGARGDASVAAADASVKQKYENVIAIFQKTGYAPTIGPPAGAPQCPTPQRPRRRPPLASARPGGKSAGIEDGERGAIDPLLRALDRFDRCRNAVRRRRPSTSRTNRPPDSTPGPTCARRRSPRTRRGPPPRAGAGRRRAAEPRAGFNLPAIL
jgi:hypothetical protein